MAGKTPREGQHIPENAGVNQDGWSTENEATATCFCGAVQMVVVSVSFDGFIHHSLSASESAGASRGVCLQLRRLSQSHQLVRTTTMAGAFTLLGRSRCRMFATNFTTKDEYTSYARGEDNVQTWSENKTPITGGYMTNGFCKTCGTLMWRQGSSFPGTRFMRVGTVDDIALHESVLKPTVEYFTKDRVEWFHGVSGAKQLKGFFDE